MVFVHVIFVWLLFWASWILILSDRNLLKGTNFMKQSGGNRMISWIDIAPSHEPWWKFTTSIRHACIYLYVFIFFAYVNIYIFCIFIYIYTHRGLRGYQPSFVLHHFRWRKLIWTPTLKSQNVHLCASVVSRSRGREALWWRFSWRDGPSAMPGHIGRLQWNTARRKLAFLLSLNILRSSCIKWS